MQVQKILFYAASNEKIFLWHQLFDNHAVYNKNNMNNILLQYYSVVIVLILNLYVHSYLVITRISLGMC